MLCLITIYCSRLFHTVNIILGNKQTFISSVRYFIFGIASIKIIGYGKVKQSHYRP
jgi:uncharacterized membrane protein YuzA (DUF378 family)